MAGVSEKYDTFIAHAPEIYAATATSKVSCSYILLYSVQRTQARSESAKALREQLDEKRMLDMKMQSRPRALSAAAIRTPAPPGTCAPLPARIPSTSGHTQPPPAETAASLRAIASKRLV